MFPLHWKWGYVLIASSWTEVKQGTPNKHSLALQDELHCFYHVCCLVLEDAAVHTGICVHASLENVKEHISAGGG